MSFGILMEARWLADFLNWYLGAAEHRAIKLLWLILTHCFD